MVALITDPALEAQLIAERSATGADKYDEVWEGIYVMAPLADNEHQQLVGQLTTILTVAVEWSGLGQVLPGANVSDQRQNWKHNYRCPDVLVFRTNTKAENCGTHWYGGPDFAIEIVSHNDKTLEKLPFYASVGSHELLVVDRDPWSLTLYRLEAGQMEPVGQSSLDNGSVLSSNVLPLTFRLTLLEGVGQIEIVHQTAHDRWLIKTQSLC